MRFPRTLSLLSLTVFAILLTSLAHADFTDGVSGYLRGDYETASKEWLPLAKAGNREAQFQLGGLYADGQGVPQDYAQSREWYRKAAAQGHALAQNNLGVMYHLGQGVQQDFAEAARWVRKAAEQGHVKAQPMLGFMYGKGQDRPTGLRSSQHVVQLSGSYQGNEMAVKNREVLAKKMTPEQIAETQRLAREWLAQHQK